MSDLFYYSVESAMCIAVLYVFYYFVLRKDTFFSINRSFLIFSVAFALLIPLLNIPLWGINSSSQEGMKVFSVTLSELQTIKSKIYQTDPVIITSSQQGVGLSTIQLLTIIYLTGVAVSMGFFIFKITILLKNIMNAEKTKDGKYCIVKTRDQHSQIYSFFHFIFIHESKLGDENFKPAIEHEKIHASKLHSIDLILVELIIVLQWFNPFIYLLRKMVVENHEFQTDRSVLQTPVQKENYLRMILDQVINSHYFKMTSAFNYSLSKNRLKMLTQMKPSTNKAKFKFLALLPILASMFIFFSYPDSIGKTAKTEQMPKEEQKATKTDTIRENEDVFKKVEEMPVYKKGQGIEGFLRDMQMKLKYPEKAAEKGISGTVYLRFIVNKNGKPVNPEILRKAHPLLNEAALNAFEKMPDWKEPGSQRGEKVDVQFNIPVAFRLDEEKSNP